MYRLTPDESTSTDARPKVDDTATAYYLLSGGLVGSVSDTQLVVTGAQLMGTGVSTSIKQTFTWAGASSYAATLTGIAMAALF